MKNRCRKSLICILSAIIILGVANVSIQAAEITPYIVSCSNCGGDMSYSYENTRTNTIIGTCDENPSVIHYLAYRYKMLKCYDCGMIESKVVVATGHYCLCDCSNTGCWCWN